jgi:hypothetical protein
MVQITNFWGGNRHALTTSYTGLTLIIAAGTMTGVCPIFLVLINKGYDNGKI